MTELILGPILRSVEETAATIWVETDRPAAVEVLGHHGRSFTVAGHHYAMVVVRGLEPGRDHPYEVHLDGDRAWPPADGALPRPTIRTLGGPPYRVLFGSCRAAAPEEPPWTCVPGEHPRARGHDALLTFARELVAGRRDRPDLMLWLGDQVYADDASPQTREFIRSRRDVSEPPGEEVNDLEEYARLYREAWDVPELRWFQASVASAMIFDDHDVIDDWNISADWLEKMRAEPWWHERITSALASYWVHQHLGNLSPDELEADPLFAEVCAADDAAELLLQVGHDADRDPTTFRWSYDRWLGDAHLIVVDSRAARTFTPHRDMLDPPEWEWFESQLRQPARHLLVASSLPVVTPLGQMLGEMWNEAVAGGAWGRRAAGYGERLRQALDLERWGSFGRSFERLAGDLHDVLTGPEAPRSALLLSGDVHYGYSAELDWPGETHPPAWQLTASPMRNLISERFRRMVQAGDSPVGRGVGRFLARAAGVPLPEVDWHLRDGPITANHIGYLTVAGDQVDVEVLRAVGDPDEVPHLERAFARRLA